MNVQISSEDVKQYSNQLNTLKMEMMDIFQDIQTKMNAISSIWNSPASQKFQSEFQSMYPVFQSFVEGMDVYAHFLSQTVQSYQENENMLQGVLG